MANFTLKNTGSNLDMKIADKGNAQLVTRDQSLFTRNTGTYFFTNFPEDINSVTGSGAPFGENGYCVFRKQVPSGEAYVFYSHTNKSGKAFTYGIQVYNPTGATITVKKLKYGSCTGWTGAETAAKNYLDDTTVQTQNIASGGNWWIKEHNVPASTSSPFCGHLLFNTTGSAIITAYMYTNKNNLTGTETIFPYTTFPPYYNPDDLKKISGTATGYRLSKTFNLTIDASSVVSATNLGRNNFWFVTSERAYTDSGMLSQIPPFTLQDNTTASPTAQPPRNESSNYGAEYNFTIRVQNKTSSAKTVYGFIGSYTARVALKSSNSAAKTLETNKAWRFIEESIPANTTKEFNYTYMLGSYGCAAAQHGFSINSNFDKPF
jgi:hypothetical protein